MIQDSPTRTTQWTFNVIQPEQDIKFLVIFGKHKIS